MTKKGPAFGMATENITGTCSIAKIGNFPMALSTPKKQVHQIIQLVKLHDLLLTDQTLKGLYC